MQKWESVLLQEAHVIKQFKCGGSVYLQATAYDVGLKTDFINLT